MNNVTRSWKTTLAGILSLAFTALQIWHNPETLTDPKTVTGVAAGIGLILAKDGDVAGTTDSAGK
jgi:pterin-4a-carbinolamine dehydratase